MTDRSLSLFCVCLKFGELYAAELTPTDVAAYNAGADAFVAIVLARNELDALDLGRRLTDAAAQRASTAFDAGRFAVLEELKAFLREEFQRNNERPTSPEWIGVGAEIERLSTWAQARMCPECRPSADRCPDTERPR
jgi:hypothetical protein